MRRFSGIPGELYIPGIPVSQFLLALLVGYEEKAELLSLKDLFVNCLAFCDELVFLSRSL